MKIKEGFMLREVAGNNIVVGVGERSLDFNGIINVNETGAEIWKLFQQDTTPEAAAKAMTEEFEVNYETALNDVNEFVEKLRKSELIDE